jgi:hypothetical protein
MMRGMTWTAPQVDRNLYAAVGDERTLLETFLDYHRQTLLWKCAGLDAEALRTASAPPSNLTLLGLVRHMTEVERWWFSTRVAGAPHVEVYCTDERPDADFEDVEQADPQADFAAFAAECQRSREVAAAYPLEHTFIHPRRQREMSLRWVYLHMIEEYARHNGHADLIRERIDGVTGD